MPHVGLWPMCLIWYQTAIRHVPHIPNAYIEWKILGFVAFKNNSSKLCTKLTNSYCAVDPTYYLFRLYLTQVANNVRTCLLVSRPTDSQAMQLIFRMAFYLLLYNIFLLFVLEVSQFVILEGFPFLVP